VRDRIELVDRKHPRLSARRQCELLGVARSSVDYEPVGESAEDLRIKRLLDEIYLIDPCLGSRRLPTVLEREHGVRVNRKRLQRLRREMGHEAIWRRPRTSVPDASHRKYPYLLRNLAVTRPDQVWCADITYSAPGSRRHPGRCCRGANMSGMHLDLCKEETRRMPAICYEIARAEAEVTCRTLAG